MDQWMLADDIGDRNIFIYATGADMKLKGLVSQTLRSTLHYAKTTIILSTDYKPQM